MENDERYLRAKKKVEQLKGFYIHLLVFVLVNIIFFVVNFLSNPGYWWFLYPLGGWGIGIIVHGISTMASLRFGDAWEKRKISEYMEKDKV